MSTTKSNPTLDLLLLLAFVVGRWHQFAKSGFNRDPMEHWTVQSRELI